MILVPRSLALAVLAAATAAASAVADHRWFHADSPVVLRLRGLYPERVHVHSAEGTTFTVENRRDAMTVVPGAEGDPYLEITLDAGLESAMGELVAGGAPAGPEVRVRMAALIACASEVNIANPASSDPPTPGHDHLSGALESLVHMRHSLRTMMRYMAKAGAAGNQATRIYWGLRAKLELSTFEDWKRTALAGLLAEFEADRRAGRIELAGDGWWSGLLDLHAFSEATRSARGETSSLLETLEERLQGEALHPHRADDPAGVTEARLALVRLLRRLSDSPCSLDG